MVSFLSCFQSVRMDLQQIIEPTVGFKIIQSTNLSKYKDLTDALCKGKGSPAYNHKSFSNSSEFDYAVVKHFV